MERRTFLQGILGIGTLSLEGENSYLSPLFDTKLTANKRLFQGSSNLSTGNPNSKNFGQVRELGKKEKHLSFYNCHTGEKLKKCVFWAEGVYNSQALREINRFFRDHRTQDIIAIDVNLLQLLHEVAKKLETHEPIHLISGYRSAKTNKKLCQLSQGVAKKSEHMTGKAADIFIPGRLLRHVKRTAQSFKKGGVGLYSNFVHMDTGRVRFW